MEWTRKPNLTEICANSTNRQVITSVRKRKRLPSEYTFSYMNENQENYEGE